MILFKDNVQYHLSIRQSIQAWKGSQNYLFSLQFSCDFAQLNFFLVTLLIKFLSLSENWNLHRRTHSSVTPSVHTSLRPSPTSFIICIFTSFLDVISSLQPLKPTPFLTQSLITYVITVTAAAWLSIASSRLVLLLSYSLITFWCTYVQA